MSEGEQIRVGYCCTCEHTGNLPDAAREIGNPCNGCWMTDEKPNWQKVMMRDEHGNRSIFDDVDE